MNIKKILSFVIILTMLLSVLSACTGDKGGDDVTTPSDTTTDPTDVTTDPDDLKKDVLFDVSAFKSSYSGETVNILCWDSEHPEFEVNKSELSGGEPLLDAIYSRNMKLQDALGVTLVFTEHTDGASLSPEVLKYVEMQADGGIPFDIMAVYSRTAAVLSQKGHLLPVNYYPEYINLNNSWYPDALVAETNIKGNTYYVSGDISTNLLYMTYGFIFNKDVLKDNPDIGYTEESLYKLVEENKWTLEEMYKLIGSYWLDADENGVKSTEDGFGLRSYNYHFDAFYTGSDLQYLTVDNSATESGKLITISSDYIGQKSIDLADTLGDLLASNNACNDSDSGWNFTKDKDLSIVTRVRDIQKIHDSENNDMRYGVLPIPKYDLAQADYKCVAGNPLTLWGISADTVDYDREVIAAAVIEYMGYLAQQETTEVIFESLFKGRYSEFPEDAASFEIIRRTTSFDIGRFFTEVISIDFGIADEWSSAVAKSQKWTTKAQMLKRLFEQGVLNASNDFWKLTDTLKPTPKS
ncbi:MAG: hypothetical protein J6D45_04475 [Clostridia bacterium]|nr:hypothetical protein [Clostridia bacterium]